MSCAGSVSKWRVAMLRPTRRTPRLGPRCRLGAQHKTASGERSRAESVAPATDPPNLIWLVPAKEAGPHRSDAVPSRGHGRIDSEVPVSRPRITALAALALVFASCA